MRTKPAALGYLRTDVSGVQQQWDETRIRSLAARLGYALRKTVAFGERTDQPVERLVNVVRRLDAEAVVVPGPHHFEGHRIPAELVRVVDVITVDPDATHARTALGELPELNGAP
ncbi:hypothetical protein LTV02_08480 [Nocardia yamanashiensis]|uniref:hypothetical protein n=1 Tax=Nocardia yamanashiensis TaxID=209247 RepID=UPI001E4432F8|nr:hypothetical protein [Nocardia yamanashiensis]UGT43407.1 hypothetical protein LTV02_08480 [Nocardia yamanashiensis]